MSFSKQIQAFNEKVEKAASLVFRGASLSIFSAVVKRTPVGNPDLWLYKHPQKGYVDYLTYKDAPEGYTGGRLRSNWQVSLDNLPIGEIDSTDKQGSKTINIGSSIINKAKINNTVYLINNLPYAQVVEEGSPTQAPAGMVRVTIAEWRYIVMRNAKKYKR